MRNLLSKSNLINIEFYNEWEKHKKYNSALIYTSIASGSLWLINGIHAYIVGPRPKKDIIQKWDVAIPKQK